MSLTKSIKDRGFAAFYRAVFASRDNAVLAEFDRRVMAEKADYRLDEIERRLSAPAWGVTNTEVLALVLAVRVLRAAIISWTKFGTAAREAQGYRSGRRKSANKADVGLLDALREADAMVSDGPKEGS